MGYIVCIRENEMSRKLDWMVTFHAYIRQEILLTKLATKNVLIARHFNTFWTDLHQHLTNVALIKVSSVDKMFLNCVNEGVYSVVWSINFRGLDCTLNHQHCFYVLPYLTLPKIVLIQLSTNHDDVIKLKHFPRYWPVVRGIHRSPVNSPHKGQWRGALILSLIYGWTNGWVNNRDAGD